MKVKNLILGAGIAGLACARVCNDRGEEAYIYESKDYSGGLCHSFVVNGFRFDSAVHLSFTVNRKARDFFDKTPYLTHLPVLYNFYNSIWIKHPVLNNLFPLSADEKVQCLKSFIERKDIYADNYFQWLKANYGEVIAEKFYSLYTKKYWTVDAEELSTTWIGERLNSPDLEKILKGAFSEKTGLDYYAAEMRYPTGGGYSKFLNPLLQGIKINYNKCAVRVNLAKKYVEFKDGTVCFYENLISSIPLPELVQYTVDVPEEIRNSSRKLIASKVSLVSVGFQKPDIPKWLFFYIYDEDIMAARVNSPSIKSRENVPPGCSSLQFEIYHNPHDFIHEESIVENTRYAIKKMKICNDEDIMFMDYRVLPYGNVIFYKGMEADRDSIKEFYTGKGVKLIGRFGEWDYLWSDQSYLSGYNVGKEI